MTRRAAHRQWPVRLDVERPDEPLAEVRQYRQRAALARGRRPVQAVTERPAAEELDDVLRVTPRVVANFRRRKVTSGREGHVLGLPFGVALRGDDAGEGSEHEKDDVTHVRHRIRQVVPRRCAVLRTKHFLVGPDGAISPTTGCAVPSAVRAGVASACR